VKLICAECNKEFLKEDREYKRRLKINPNIRFFCSRSCSAKTGIRENPQKGNAKFLTGFADNRRDEYTPFRWFILRAQYRNKKNNRGCNITVEYLKKLWQEQNGICSLSGKELILPIDSDGWLKTDPYNASLDRIDNSKGYIEGNVRFIAFMANVARLTFTDEQLKEFCKNVNDYTKL